MRKKDHDEIKAYLINYINTLWNKNADFVAVYGRDYPKNQLKQNLQEFRFNRSTSLNNGGDFDLLGRNIYIYNKDYPIYTLTDLLKSTVKKELMLTLIHEMLHAIFGKNLNTEKDPNKRITGIEIYDEVHRRVINTPLNEGYTEYLRWKLENKGKPTYSHYIKVFQILEKKIGKRGVIALAKGDVAQNMANAFNMTKDEFMEFCRTSERKFISERKLQVLESKYDEFCEKYPEGTIDSNETRKAIIKFDKAVHKSLYRRSIMEILPLKEGEIPTMQQFHEFLTFKIDSLHEQTEKFHKDLCYTAREACLQKNKKSFLRIKSKIFGYISKFKRYDVVENRTEDFTNNEESSNKRHNRFVSEMRERAGKSKSLLKCTGNSNIEYYTNRKDFENLDL